VLTADAASRVKQSTAYRLTAVYHYCYHSKIVAVDLQSMAPLDCVNCFQGDICDGGSDVKGLHELDEIV
jgi:23S rRNA U2552 (ribose-2'-O)-methylase RlmE/FtsJ